MAGQWRRWVHAYQERVGAGDEGLTMDGAIKRGSALTLVCLTTLVVLLAAAGSSP